MQGLVAYTWGSPTNDEYVEEYGAVCVFVVFLAFCLCVPALFLRVNLGRNFSFGRRAVCSTVYFVCVFCFFAEGPRASLPFLRLRYFFLAAAAKLKRDWANRPDVCSFPSLDSCVFSVCLSFGVRLHFVGVP